MNEIVNIFFVGSSLYLKKKLKLPGFRNSNIDHLLKIKKEHNNL